MKIMMKYEVGEQVRIKDDFNHLRFKDDPNIDPKMLDDAGKVYIVSKHHNETCKWYKLQGNYFVWDERWLEPVEEDITMTENDIMEMLL